MSVIEKREICSIIFITNILLNAFKSELWLVTFKTAEKINVNGHINLLFLFLFMGKDINVIRKVQ